MRRTRQQRTSNPLHTTGVGVRRFVKRGEPRVALRARAMEARRPHVPVSWPTPRPPAEGVRRVAARFPNSWDLQISGG